MINTEKDPNGQFYSIFLMRELDKKHSGQFTVLKVPCSTAEYLKDKTPNRRNKKTLWL